MVASSDGHPRGKHTDAGGSIWNPGTRGTRRKGAGADTVGVATHERSGRVRGDNTTMGAAMGNTYSTSRRRRGNGITAVRVADEVLANQSRTS